MRYPIGVPLVFFAPDAERLRAEWESERVTLDLRLAVLVAAALMADSGCHNPVVEKLLSQDPGPHKTGRAALMQAWTIPGCTPRVLEEGRPPRQFELLLQRLDRLLGMPAGAKVAIWPVPNGTGLERKVFQVRVPDRGLPAEALALWPTLGAGGLRRSPDRLAAELSALSPREARRAP